MRKIVDLGVILLIFFVIISGLVLNSIVYSFNESSGGNATNLFQNSFQGQGVGTKQGVVPGWNPRVLTQPEGVITKDGQKMLPKTGIGGGGPNFLPNQGISGVGTPNQFSIPGGARPVDRLGGSLVSCPPEVTNKLGFCPQQSFVNGTMSVSNFTSVPQSNMMSTKSISGDSIRDDKIIEFYKPKDVNLTEPEIVQGVYYKIGPEKTYFVQMSGLDINRVVCPTDVQEVVYSEERGVKINISGRNIFIKFLVNKVGNEYKISSIPADFYIVCNNKVYSIVGIPAKIPGVMIYLEDKEAELKNVLAKREKLSFEENILSSIRSVFAGKIPDGAEYVKTGKVIDVYSEILLKEEGYYDMLGSGYIIRYFIVTNRSGRELKLHERMFLRKEVVIAPIAVSLEKLYLKPGEDIALIIVEKKVKNINAQ